jgi:hypothetical protein
MCWSSSASIAATAIGGAATIYAAKKGYPKAQVVTLGFFTLMELLQAVSYVWIGQCDLGVNDFLTKMSFLHITFQPTVLSAYMLSFLPEKKRQKWSKLAMGVGVTVTTLLFIKMIVPMIWEVPLEHMCRIGESMCGRDVCTYAGDWHQAWRLPLLGYIPTMLYGIPVFIIPLFYGSWRASLYHFALGPLLAHSLTSDPNEWPAIWCLFSIVLASTVFLKPVRKHLRLDPSSSK